MHPPEVSEAKPADVVVTGFTDEELTELRRGILQRMGVARSNMYDKRLQDANAAWKHMYDTCRSAYLKMTPVPSIMDEHEYLTRKPD